MACSRSNDVRLEQVLPLMLEELNAGRPVQFSPNGISMQPMLLQGRDSVVLSPLPPRLKKYDLPLYRRANGQFVLHRVVAVGDTYTCIGDNQYVLEPGLSHDQMIAVVTAFTRKGRDYSVDCAAYRLYCRLWHFTRPLRGATKKACSRLMKKVRRIKRRILG